MKNQKKYILILGDGMSDDYTLSPSPLMTARKPNADRLAGLGKIGLCRTVPDGFSPGSDVANLSILGYNPADCYTGRSPLEALSMGIEMKKGDLAYRCNLVTVEGQGGLDNCVMKDYSAGNISSGEAKELIGCLNENLDLDGLELHAGISYRHCLIERKSNPGNNSSLLTPHFSLPLTPPHDITGRPVAPCLPQGRLLSLMQEAYKILGAHPVNLARVKAGKNPANSIWFWGQGGLPVLDSFESKYGIEGAMISAVDLLKGIAAATKMTVVSVAGATACIDTDYKGMADAALDALRNHGFVYLHIAAPDECAHHGDYENKKRAIELIDQKIIGYLLPLLDKSGYDYTVIFMPDHATPVAIKTHTSAPVPYLVYRKGDMGNGARKYDEPSAAGSAVEVGHKFLKKILGMRQMKNEAN